MLVCACLYVRARKDKDYQDVRYGTGDRLSESYFGFSHHTGAVVFPVHPLREKEEQK